MMRRITCLVIAAAGCASADTPALEMQRAEKALQQFDTICDSDGKLLWGVSLCGRIILVEPSTRAAIANRPDPDGGFRKDRGLYTGRFPEQFTPSNTAIRWNGEEWATVMLPLPGDPFQRLALLSHEAFHRLQRSIGLSGSDAPNAHLDTEPGRLWLRLELRALAQALRQEGDAARSAARDAMIFRADRYRLCPGAEQAESAMERAEGLAEYTGIFIALRETGERPARVARQVESFEDSRAFARSFAYETGPALGLLLDRYDGNWRARAAKASLYSLLSSALKISMPQDLEADARRRARGYGYQAIAAAESEREQQRQAFMAELKRQFIEGAVLQFPQMEMRRNFNPQNLVPFPPHGVFYPTGTFAADWGKLQVEGGGAVVAPDNRSLVVAAPADPNARPLRGEGWTLQLAPGWTVRPSARTGSLEVVRAPQAP